MYAAADAIEVHINEKDLLIETMRSSGAGGQSVQKTDSCVRVTHLPTGISITCQNERSQQQNKAQAMLLLKSRLYDMEMKKRREQKSEFAASLSQIDFGSQIRSYVLHPYKMIKDTRTGMESSNVDSILDGRDLTPFMIEALRYQKFNKVKKE